MLNVWKNFVGDMLNVWKNFVGDMLNVWKNFVSDMLNVWKNFVGDMLNVWKNFVGDMLNVWKNSTFFFHWACNFFTRNKNNFTFFLPWIFCVYFLISFSLFFWKASRLTLGILSFFFQQFSSQMNIPVWGRQSMLGLKFPFATPAITPYPLQSLFLPLYVLRIIKANE